MRAKLAALGTAAVLSTALVAAPTTTALAATGPAAAVASDTEGVTALYLMDEPVGSTVMTDSSGNGNNGIVDPAGVQTGGVYDGATGYNWVYRSPTAPPASPERVVQVPDDLALEPGNQDFTIELRMRFTDKFGNVAQKGQAQTPGGQWKIQSPGGIPSCLFKGSAGQVATGAKTPLDDGAWHTLTCVLTPSGVSMYVDGEFRNKKNGTVGTIDNNFPMTVGGKIDCDQIDVTCDYYSGQIDSLKITKGPNLAPNATFSSSCPNLTCTFNAGGSSDPDGDVAGYAWTFGDGTTGTGATPHHIYTTPGTYRVKLTVTDNRGATDVFIRDLTVDGQPVQSNVAHVATAVGAGSSTAPTVTVPAQAEAGDRLLLVFTLNSTDRPYTLPTGITGLTQVGTSLAKTMPTTVWTKVVEPGDPGSLVTVPLSGGAAKYTLTAAVYSGVDEEPQLASAASTDIVDNTTRRTPVISTDDGSWVVSYWADKSSSTTAWTPEPSVAARGSGCAPTSGRICSLLADSNAKVPATYGNVAASTNAPSSAAAMWSIVLPTDDGSAPPNDPPVAAFSSGCTFLSCDFDSAASTDDGSIASREWDFGDGSSSTAAHPQHTYAQAGSYDVTLTVTDNIGLTGSVTHTVEVEAPPATGDISYVASSVGTSSTANPSVVLPGAASAGDRAVLVFSINSTDRTFTGPSGGGWTLLDTNVAKTMATTVWTKTLQAGDAGTTVTVPLSGSAKSTLTAAVYSGVDPTTTPAFARAASTTDATTRTTPQVTAPTGSWVISYWADKSSTTTEWTTGAPVASRQAACAPTSGRICSLLADTGGQVSRGYGGIAASTGAPSGSATMWSIVLTPAT